MNSDLPESLLVLTRPRVKPRADIASGDVRRMVASNFFRVCAALAALAALVLTVLPPGLPEPKRVTLVAMFIAQSALALLGLRMVPGLQRRWSDLAMFAHFVLATAIIIASTLLIGWGLASPVLAFLGLLVCLLCAAASRAMGAGLAAVQVLSLILVAALTHDPRMPEADLTALRLLVHLLAVGAGLAGGWLISIIVERYLRSAEDREARFRGLLAVAADAYWEIDHGYRLVSASNQREEGRQLTLSHAIGQVPWELPAFGCDPETLDALLADLDTRTPFRDVTVTWRSSNGRHRVFVVSGEPRFDERGMFTGYWGVARDVTTEAAARHALRATETRYQELFSRIPTPLVLHRRGRVIGANPAGVALFGFEDLPSMLGRDLLGAYESGDSRERARRRIEELETKPPGTGLPMTDFRLRLRGGRRLIVRATGVRVDAEGGPATLSIYVDETERRDAEEAVRRSEAMLSHLVATSPDVITLTDLVSGRYAMVNDTFERLTGYSAAEVVGKTSIELGIWRRNEDRERFVALMNENGNVQDMPAQFRAKDGSIVSMLVSGARFVMDRRDYLVINARDVTDSERARLEREAILENASIGIAVTRDRRFVLTNRSFEQMFGWSTGGLLGQPGRAVWVSDADYAEVGALMGPTLARGEQAEAERPMRRRDGSTFLARIRAKAIDPSHPAHGGTIWIIEDVTERRQFEQALARARDEAEAASRAKSAFLANTSHELRTPLNGMLNLAQLARRPDLDEERRRQYLDQIADGANALAGIISDILDLSKIEAGKLHLETMPFDLPQLLRTLQQSYSTLASARDLRLELHVDEPALGVVSGDPLRVRQILSNYLTNALKFTPYGEVRMAARRLVGDIVRFEVTDSGPGIDLETQQRLFRPFTQAD